MMYLMHHAFRRDLAAFAAAVPRTPVDDRKPGRLLADRWELFAEALHHHHSGEDAWLWPALLERADRRGRGRCEAMEAEHEEIDPLLEACGRRVRPARGSTPTRTPGRRSPSGWRGPGVPGAGTSSHEETDAIAILQRVLDAGATGSELDEELFKEDITLGEVVALVPWVATASRRRCCADLFAKHRRRSPADLAA